tara:strand:+ start:407 stop:1681 length:1275 start_codon:yes stop_codon:yes gene_type:complete
VAAIDLSEFKRGWKIILSCAAGIGCGMSAMPFFTFGAFVGPLQEEFGWSRGELQAAITLLSLTVLVAFPITGKILDLVGARKVAIWSQFGFIISFSSLAFVPDNLIVFYLLWVVLAAVSVGSMTVTYSLAINSWFDRSRGVALGITLSGSGIAATFLPSYATWLIQNFGWRLAYPGLAAVSLMVSVPLLLLFLKDRPSEDEPSASMPEEKPNTSDISGMASHDIPGMTLLEAVRSYRFWIIGIGMFGVGAGTGGVVPNLIPLLGDSGYSASDAAAYAGLIGVMVVFGRVLVGILLDHLWAPLVAVLFFIPAAMANFLLTIDGIGPEAVIVSVLLTGLVAGAEYDVIAYLVSRYFGMRFYGTIYSWVYIVFASAIAAAPVLFGTSYDVFGSYDVPLIATGILIIVCVLPLLTLGPIPEEYKRQAH